MKQNRSVATFLVWNKNYSINKGHLHSYFSCETYLFNKIVNKLYMSMCDFKATHIFKKLTLIANRQIVYIFRKHWSDSNARSTAVQYSKMAVQEWCICNILHGGISFHISVIFSTFIGPLPLKMFTHLYH